MIKTILFYLNNTIIASCMAIASINLFTEPPFTVTRFMLGVIFCILGSFFLGLMMFKYLEGE